MLMNFLILSRLYRRSSSQSQIMRKENPRNIPRAPPNSATRDSRGYMRTSVLLLTVALAITRDTREALRNETSWGSAGRVY